MGVRKPQSDKQLQRLCELYVEVDKKITAIEEARDVAIAAANAEVDRDLAPLLKERALIEEKAGPYFMQNRDRLLPAKRKSVELGGAMLGSRKGKDSVSITGETKDIVASLRSSAWGRALLSVKYSLDVGRIKDALGGKREAEIKALGIAISEGEDAFFIKRTEQGGTQAKG